MKTVTIPDSVTGVGAFAFAGCSGLTDIVSPEPTEVSAALAGELKAAVCRVLAAVTGADSKTSIGVGAFYLCSSLTNITIPEGVTGIGDTAFYGCSSLESVTIPESVTAIGDNAFGECAELKDVRYCGSEEQWNVISMGEGNDVVADSEIVFNYNLDHTHSYTPAVTTPATCTTDGVMTYTWECSNSYTEAIPATGHTVVDGICTSCHRYGYCGAEGDNLIWELSEDGTLTISGTGEMTDAPWRNSYSRQIKKLIIEEGITGVLGNSFKECYSLQKVSIAGSVKKIGGGAFDRCSSLYSVTLGEGVEWIGSGAFRDCSQLGSIVLPNSVSRIEVNAFIGTKLYKTESNWDNGVLYIGNFLIRANNVSGSYAIKEGTLCIADQAFSACRELTAVKMPGSIERISEYAFSWCTKLKEVQLDGVKSIAKNAFYQCVALPSVVIPESVTEIEDGAFSGCSNLCEIYFMGDKPDMTAWAFRYDYGVAFYLAGKDYSPLTYTNYSNVYVGWFEVSDFDIENNPICYGKCGDNITWQYSKGGTLTLTGSGSMYDYEGLGKPWYTVRRAIRNIVISEGITSIGNYAFRGVEAAASVTIPSTVTTIGEYAFFECGKLTSITIPEGVTSIGRGAFCDCSTIQSLSIPGSVLAVGDAAFSRCSSIETVSIGEGVTSIGKGAFANNKKLTSVTIPASVSSIKASAFTLCSALTDVYYGGTEEEWNNPAVISIGTDNDPLLNATLHAHVHSYTPAVTTPATCTTDGVTTYTCECGNSYTEAIPAGHTVSDGICTSCHRYGYCGAEGDGSNAVWELSEDGTLTISGMGAMKSYLLPGNIRFGLEPLAGYYNYRDSIKKLVINEGITALGNTAFYYCSKLETVSLPQSLTELSRCAFYYCSSLKTVSIPASVTYIGYDAFCGCEAMESIALEEGNATFVLVDGVLYNAEKTRILLYPPMKAGESYEILDTATEMNAYVFHSNRYLKEIIIPDGMKFVNVSSFENAVSLEHIELPDSVTLINAAAFRGCTNLKTVDTGDGVGSIYDKVFMNCPNLETVRIGKNVSGISFWSFNGCGKLVSIDVDPENTVYSSPNGVLIENGTTIRKYPEGKTDASYCVPEGITTLYDSAFSGATAIKKMYIPLSVTSISSYGFMNCGVKDVYYAGTEAQWKAISVDPVGNHLLTNATIHYNHTHSNTPTVTTPATCTTDGVTTYTCECGLCYTGVIPALGHNVVNGICTNCQHYGYCGAEGDGSNAVWELSEDGTLTISGTGNMADYECIYVSGTGVGGTAPWNGCSDSIKKVVMTDGVTCVGNNAFYCCSSLESVIFPDGIESIGTSAFCCCTKLEAINLPDSVISIGDWAFTECSGATAISLSNSLKSIGEGAFSNCAGVTSLTIPGSVESMGMSVFAGCSALTSLIIEDGVTVIGDYAFQFCSSLTEINLPDSITHIKDCAFYSCTSLTEINLPDSLTYMGYHSFSCCNSLTEATIPGGVKIVGDEAFSCCEGLSSVTICDGVKRIDTHAFENCSSLINITIGTGLESIGEGAFFGTAIYNDAKNWEDGVLYIGKYLVEAESSIETCDVKEGTLLIADETFYNCADLASVTIPDGVAHIGMDAFFGTAIYNDAKNWEDGVLYVGKYLIETESFVETCDVKEGALLIADNAFESSWLTSVTIPASMKYIGYFAFACQSELTDVYYGGTEDDWKLVWIGDYNDELTNATIHFHEHSYGAPVWTWAADGKSASAKIQCHCGAYLEGNASISSAVKTAATCTVMGTTTYTASVTLNGTVYTDTKDVQDIAIIAHSFGAWTVTTAPSCTVKGVETRYCANCTAFETREVDPLGHDTVSHAAKAPTCTEVGWYAYDTCSRCTYTTYVEIPATGHSHVAVVTKPGCTTQGYTTHTCACGDSYVDSYTDPLGHNFVNGVCTRCGEKQAVPTMSILTPSTTKVKYGDTLILHTYVENMPADSHIEWSVSGSGAQITPSADGSTCAVKCTATGTVTVTAKLVYNDGTPVTGTGGELSADQSLTMDGSGWNKFISFFKDLFGVNRVTERSR